MHLINVDLASLPIEHLASVASCVWLVLCRAGMESSGVERIVLVREVDMTVQTQYCSPCQSQRRSRDGMMNVTAHLP